MKSNFEVYALTGFEGGELYCISVKDGRASAMQIAEWSDTERGQDLCSPEYPTLMIGSRLRSYFPREDDRDPAKVAPENWGNSSAPVIALFLDIDTARRAFETRSRTPTTEWDTYTYKALLHFGTNHQEHFFIVTDPKTRRLSEPTSALEMA